MLNFHESPDASHEYDTSLFDLVIHSKQPCLGSCSDECLVSLQLKFRFPHARIACWWLKEVDCYDRKLDHYLSLLTVPRRQRQSHPVEGKLTQHAERSLEGPESDYDANIRLWFPRPRSPPPIEDGGLMQQADDLLEDLKRARRDHHSNNRPRRPIVFVCQGMTGGLVLKQALLKLNQNPDVVKGLRDSVSGVFFLGCAHDERTDKFSDRVYKSLHAESNKYFAHIFRSISDWVESTTAEFRKLELPFQVWTYYESVASVYRVEERLWRKDIVHSEIFCPSEILKFQAAPYGTVTFALNHAQVCDILSQKDGPSERFLNDLREMVDTLVTSKFVVSSGAGQTVERERAAGRSDFVIVPETHDRSTSSANDRFTKQAGKPHANNKSNDLGTAGPSRNESQTPKIMDYKVGWICALPFETAAAEVMLDEQHSELAFDPYDPTIYTLGRVGSHNVVIACLPAGRPGTSAATAVAKGMREKFRGIRLGFMVGIGGGVPSSRVDIRLGDVVVSSPHLDHGGVVQYDFGKAEEGGMFRRTGYLNSPPTVVLNVVNRVRTNHERGRRTYPTHMKRYAEENMEEYTLPQYERDELFNASYPHTGDFDCTNCDPGQIINRRERNTKNSTIKIHYGTIASGNQVIKDAETRDRIVRDLGGQVLCFEMEAAGLMNDFPCLVIRGISDYCDSHKNDGWQRYAAASAAAYTRELLLSMPSGDVVE